MTMPSQAIILMTHRYPNLAGRVFQSPIGSVVQPLTQLHLITITTTPVQRVDYRINNSVLQKADTDADTNTNTAGTFQSLIEGIENMQILYGADTNADECT